LKNQFYKLVNEIGEYYLAYYDTHFVEITFGKNIDNIVCFSIEAYMKDSAMYKSFKEIATKYTVIDLDEFEKMNKKLKEFIANNIKEIPSE